MKGRELSCNYLLAVDAFRCNSVQVQSIRVLLSEQEMAILEQARALGFSSKAELLRCATLAWIDAAAQLPDESPPPCSAADGADISLSSTAPSS